MMLSTSIATMSFIMFATIFAMPISGTHTTVGALIGAGMVGVGFHNVYWSKLILIGLSWVVSPVLSAVLCFLLFMVVCRLTLNEKK